MTRNRFMLPLICVAIFSCFCAQSEAGIIVNISNNGSGGIDFSWSGQVNSVAGLSDNGSSSYSNNQLGNAGSFGHYFMVGSSAFGKKYSGYSGVFDALTFSTNKGGGSASSSDPGVGYFNNEIILPFQYVLGPSFSGTATFDDVQLTSGGSSVVTWDNGNEFFQVNTNLNTVPEPTTLTIFASLIGLTACRRRRS